MMELSWKGLIISMILALSLGGIFTPDIPVTANEWYRIVVGFITATAVQYVLWSRIPPKREKVWTEQERAEVRQYQKDNQ